ncbi:MAG: hypothetical protein P0116_14675 [Candidatus Nitrosocosmicus sp.]|nr:hypothetical protein [Candidatus Nitrosocosmicus sp.]
MELKFMIRYREKPIPAGKDRKSYEEIDKVEDMLGCRIIKHKVR